MRRSATFDRARPVGRIRWRMLPGFFAVCIAMLLTGCGLGCAVWHRHSIRVALSKEAQYGSARLTLQETIPVIHLYGTPREMGKQHGALLRKALQSFDAYLRAILPSSQLEEFLAQAKLYSRGLPSEYREELKAMAESSGIPYDNLLALNVIPRLRCSALAVWGNATRSGEMILGRNADYFGLGLSDRGSMIVIYHPNRGKAVAAITFLGMIGAFTGVNEDGVAFGNMLVFNAANSHLDPEGLPVQLAMRMAAHSSATAAEFSSFMQERKHIIPMNAVVADSTEAFVLELCHGSTHMIRGDRDYVAVSNHFRSKAIRSHRETCPRLTALESFAEKHRGSFDVQLMKEAMYEARIPQLNLQTAIFEPANMRMHVSMNRVPASRGPYVTFDLHELFRADASRENSGDAGQQHTALDAVKPHR